MSLLRTAFPRVARPFFRNTVTQRSLTAGSLGLGLASSSLAFLARPKLECQPPSATGTTKDEPLTKGEDAFGGPQLPQTQISLASLGFGSMTGICCGIFALKGLRAIAFLLGGLFVTLQWLNSKSIARVNWSSVESGYNSTVDRLSGKDVQKGQGNLKKVFESFVRFVTADFPQRATFVAGFFLGLRLG